ncbi:MAG: ROK family protein, partial [Clostridia bacterium]
TGVGSAYFDKELGFDKSLELSKIGHYTLVKDGIQCNCGKRGCIEQYISAGALYKLGGARGLAITDCNDIFSLSRADNIIAKEVIDEFVNNLVEAIKLIKQRLDTNVIIFGGGLISTKEFWLPQTQSRVEDVTLLPAKLGNQAGMLGAYVWYNIRQSSK